MGSGVKVWCCLSEINTRDLSQQPEARLASYKPVSEGGKRSQSNPNNNQVSPNRNSPPPRNRLTSLIKSAHASFRFFVGLSRLGSGGEVNNMKVAVLAFGGDNIQLSPL